MMLYSKSDAQVDREDRVRFTRDGDGSEYSHVIFRTYEKWGLYCSYPRCVTEIIWGIPTSDRATGLHAAIKDERGEVLCAYHDQRSLRRTPEGFHL